MLGVLFDVQKGRCAICGKGMDPVRTAKVQSNPSRPTRDHVLPQALGGPDEPGNLLAAHARCNTEKGDGWPGAAELAELGRVNREMGWCMPHKLRSAT